MLHIDIFYKNPGVGSCGSSRITLDIIPLKGFSDKLIYISLYSEALLLSVNRYISALVRLLSKILLVEYIYLLTILNKLGNRIAAILLESSIVLYKYRTEI